MIAANEDAIDKNESAYRDFLAATKRGFMYAAEFPEEAVKILKPFVPKTDAKINLSKALDISQKSFGSADDWGKWRKVL